jgi:hypothetical protein
MLLVLLAHCLVQKVLLALPLRQLLRLQQELDCYLEVLVQD